MHCNHSQWNVASLLLLSEDWWRFGVKWKLQNLIFY